jgi:hypothetical protein
MSRFDGIATKDLHRVIELANQIESLGFEVRLTRLRAPTTRNVNGEIRSPKLRRKFSRSQKAYWKKIRALMRAKNISWKDARKAYRTQPV